MVRPRARARPSPRAMPARPRARVTVCGGR